MSMFKAIIIGNLGRDAEEREYNGKRFLSFTVAVTEKDKENQEHTQWINVTTPQLGLKEYLKKGIGLVGSWSQSPFYQAESSYPED